MNGTQRHWLARPATVRKLWFVFAAVLAATVLAEAFIASHPHFTLDGIFGFNAVYGFVACVVMVLVAKGLGALLKRHDGYYERD
jgi:hypothetical protein